MRDLVARLDQWRPSTLLWLSAAIALLMLIAHVGAAVVQVSQTGGTHADVISFLGVDDLAAVAILVTAVIGLLSTDLRWTALRMQTLVLLALAANWIYWAVSLAVGELTDGGFVWNPLLFAFGCAYPVYLLRRAFLANSLSSSWALNYAHVLTAIACLVMSGPIVYKAMTGIA